MKNELHNVLSGKISVRFGATIQAITHYLTKGTPTSSKIKNSKHFKKQEAESLEGYITKHNLWVSNIDFSQYISEGAEQKVYLKDTEFVLKLNDSIYYVSWEDYLYNLLLHNYFFSDTAYELVGFVKKEDVLYAVVKQAFVIITAKTNLNKVRDFLAQNGFNKTRNNDYYNPDLGIILEDLHDENVLTKNEMLYFIDTVFFITDNFWV
jgi:hypothetical protein